MATTITHKKQLLNDISTLNDLNKLKTNIDVLSTSLFKTNTHLKRKIDKLFTPHQSEILYQILTHKKINFIKNAQRGQSTLQDIQRYLDTISILHLTIATKLPQKNISQISDWLNADTAKKTVLDINIDKNIIAGARIYKQGIYRDYTLAKQIDKNIKHYVKI